MFALAVQLPRSVVVLTLVLCILLWYLHVSCSVHVLGSVKGQKQKAFSVFAMQTHQRALSKAFKQCLNFSFEPVCPYVYRCLCVCGQVQQLLQICTLIQRFNIQYSIACVRKNRAPPSRRFNMVPVEEADKIGKYTGCYGIPHTYIYIYIHTYVYIHTHRSVHAYTDRHTYIHR